MSDIFGSEVNYGGVLRVKAKNFDKRIQRYQPLLDKGYIYARGCGRFFLNQVCTCCKCRKKLKI